MWQRWNGTSHIFEKSDDNGSTWAPLPLDASIINQGAIPDARLSANVAMRNAANNFGANWISAGVLRGTTNAPGATSGAGLEVQYASGQGVLIAYDRSGAGLKPILIYGSTVALGDQTGQGVLTIPGTGNVQIGTIAQNLNYEKLMVGGPIACSYAASASPYTQARISIYNDGANWAYISYGGDIYCRFIYSNTAYGGGIIFGSATGYAGTGAISEHVKITPGALTVTGSINATSHIANTGFLYPGRMDVAGQQSSWYLASHGGYGLYCSSGFYAAGAIWSASAIDITGTITGHAAIDAVQGFTGRKGAGGVSGQPFQYYWNGGGMEGYAGAAYLGLVTGLSDGRLKTNIKSVPNALAALNLLNPVTFEWIEGVGRPGTYYGLVAQEVESELPGIVEIVENLEGAPEKPLRIDYQALIPLLIRAVQELSEKIDQLES